MSSLIQNTPEWLEMRKSRIGSSDAPIIMGVSPWTTQYQLWRKKLSLDQNIETFAMTQGKEREPVALERLEEITGISLQPKVHFHPSHSWMMSSMDAVDMTGTIAYEIKCPGERDQAIAASGRVPEKYFPQLQHQLEVCQLEKMGYCSFSFLVDEYGNIKVKDQFIIEVFRDDKYIKKLVSKELEFYERMQNLIPPELSAKDYVKNTDPAVLALAEGFISLNSQIEDLEFMRDTLRNDLINKCYGKSTIAGCLKIAPVIRKGSVDFKKIPELKNVNLEQYRNKPVECWRITSA